MWFDCCLIRKKEILRPPATLLASPTAFWGPGSVMCHIFMRATDAESVLSGEEKVEEYNPSLSELNQ